MVLHATHTHWKQYIEFGSWLAGLFSWSGARALISYLLCETSSERQLWSSAWFAVKLDSIELLKIGNIFRHQWVVHLCVIIVTYRCKNCIYISDLDWNRLLSSKTILKSEFLKTLPSWSISVRDGLTTMDVYGYFKTRQNNGDL